MAWELCSTGFRDAWPSLRQRTNAASLSVTTPLEKREYVRFVVGRKDEESRVEQGIFQAAAQALEWVITVLCFDSAS